MKRAMVDPKRPLLHRDEAHIPKNDLAVSWSKAKGYAMNRGELYQYSQQRRIRRYLAVSESLNRYLRHWNMACYTRAPPVLRAITSLLVESDDDEGLLDAVHSRHSDQPRA
jgi:hypothetical protein